MSIKYPTIRDHGGYRITAEQMHDLIDLTEEIQPGYRAYIGFHVGDRSVKMDEHYMHANELHIAVDTAASLGGELFCIYVRQA